MENKIVEYTWLSSQLLLECGGAKRSAVLPVHQLLSRYSATCRSKTKTPAFVFTVLNLIFYCHFFSSGEDTIQNLRNFVASSSNNNNNQTGKGYLIFHHTIKLYKVIYVSKTFRKRSGCLPLPLSESLSFPATAGGQPFISDTYR